jgi:hypothetical protein
MNILQEDFQVKHLVSFFLLIVGIALFGVNESSAVEGTVEVSISTQGDDAEQQSGGMYMDSGDLEMMADGNDYVGLRFQNMTIPQGSFIRSAYIEFTADEVADNDNRDGILIIAGEASDDADSFDANDDNNISNRIRTGSSVEWELDNDINRWNTVGNKYQTADVSNVIEEIVGRAGWGSGNDLVLIISGNGNANRVADSYSGGSGNRPLLHVEWTDEALPRISVSPAGSLGTTSYVGTNAEAGSFVLTNTGTGVLDYTVDSSTPWFSCSTSGTLPVDASVEINVIFSNSNLAVGAYNGTITISDDNGLAGSYEYDVILSVTSVVEGASCGEVPIYAQNLVDPAILVLLDVSGSMTTQMPIAELEPTKVSPDLSSIVQAIVNQGAWASGNAMAFSISGTGKRVVVAYEDMPESAPNLEVSYTSGGVTEVVSVRVGVGSDDAEEEVAVNVADRNVNLSSSDLELIDDGGDQIVGLRFTGVTIPQGATINSASISFTVDETDPTVATTLAFAGELSPDALTFSNSDGDISGRNWAGSPIVTWNITEQWGVVPTLARYVIGRNVISELVEDRSISWGYGHWSFSGHPRPGGDPDISLLPENPYGNSPNPLGLYTRIEAGVAHRSEAETAALKAEIETTEATGGTPLGPSMLAAWEYFRGNKPDEDDGFYDASVTCQPKFLIEITDGRGYPEHTLDSYIEPYTNLLGDAGVSVIAVGFGLDDPRQVGIMAQVANERGKTDENLYALHEVDGNKVGIPFMAQNQDQLVTTLQGITNAIKEQVFVGSSPAPSTSADSGTFIVNASFNSANWTGDLEARPYDPKTGVFVMCVNSSGMETDIQADIVGYCIDPLNGNNSCDVTDIVEGECLNWVASEQMPLIKDAWTVDGAVSDSLGSLGVGVAGHYVSDHSALGAFDIGLNGDNYICKDLGDIIKSSPAIVKPPHSFLNVDNYRAFVFGDARTRDSMVYVGSNDGALHAFNLKTGIEKWRFYPEKIHQRLIDTDFCADSYCHEYFVDGPSVVADIFKGTDADTSPGLGWRTMLMTGLGAGGDAYFALDITSAEVFVEANSYTDIDALTGTTYLWQFSDDELGLTMAQPVIARTSNATATYGGWGAYFGSGYDVNGSSHKEAFVYGIEAYTMSNLWMDGASFNRVKLEENNRISYESQLSTEFTAGEVVEGAVSGAQGVIDVVTDNGTSGTLVFSSITGTFSGEEILQVGGIARATLDGQLHSVYDDDALSDVLMADIDFDQTGDYLYVGNLYGRMYRLSHIAKGENPVVDVLFDIHPSVVDHSTPIRAGASYTFAPFNLTPDTVWLYFGTGRFESQIDKFNAEQQFFIGMQDKLVSPVHNSTLTDLLDRQAVAVDATFNGITKEYRIITGHSYAYDSTETFAVGDIITDPHTHANLTITDLTVLNGERIVTFAEADVVTNGAFVTGEILEDPLGKQMKIKGHPWYVSLTRTVGVPSERVVAKSLVAGGIVYFTTFVPDTDVCGGNGQAWLYALNYETGLPAEVPIFDLNGDGDVNENDVVVEDGKRYYPAAIPIGRGIPSNPVNEGGFIVVNTTGGGNHPLPIPNDKLKAKMSSWLDSHF